MSSVTIPPSVLPSPSSPDVLRRSIPSLDDLYTWTSVPDERVVIQDVDWAFYFLPEKLATVAEAMMRMCRNVAEYPNPDLALEVDVSPSKIDRPGIYAALGIAEVWRFDGEHRQIIIERLGDDGSHHRVAESALLPVRSEEVGRWVLEEDTCDGSLWGRRLRDWVRAEPVPRRPGRTD